MSARRGAASYYAVLKVKPTATLAAINDAFSKLTRVYHATSGTDPDENKMEALNKAYEVLSNERKRQAYDRMGHKDYLDVERSGGDVLTSAPRRARVDAASYVTGSYKTGTLVDESLYNTVFGGGFFESFREDEGLDPNDSDEDEVVYGLGNRERERESRRSTPSRSVREETPLPLRGVVDEGEFSGSAMFAGEREAPEGPGFERDRFYCDHKVWPVSATGRRLSKMPLKTRTKELANPGRKSAPPPDLFVLVEVEADELFCSKEASLTRHFEVSVSATCEECSGKGVSDKVDDTIYLTDEEKAKHPKCPMCKGEGKKNGHNCVVCKGSGVNLVRANISSKARSRKDIINDCKACAGQGGRSVTTLVKNVNIGVDAVDKEIVKTVNDVGVTTYASFPRRGPVQFEISIVPMAEPFNRDALDGKACWRVVDLASNWTGPNLAIPIPKPTYKSGSSDEEESDKMIIYSPNHAIRHLDVAKVTNLGFGGRGTVYFVFRVFGLENETNLHPADQFPEEFKQKLRPLSATERQKFGDVQTLGVPDSSYAYPYVKNMMNSDAAIRARRPKRQ